ncbi:MAG TPA: hypothetical protein VIY70_00100 [Acidimicrobiia bacterium]
MTAAYRSSRNRLLKATATGAVQGEVDRTGESPVFVSPQLPL